MEILFFLFAAGVAFLYFYLRSPGVIGAAGERSVNSILKGKLDEEVDTISRQANELPNLQLLDGSANIEKQAEPPSSWLDKNFPGTDQRQSYCDRHLLGDVPNDISGFGVFYEARREKLRERLIALLTATT